MEDVNDPPPIEFTEQAAREEAFNAAYLNKTGKVSSVQGCSIFRIIRLSELDDYNFLEKAHLKNTPANRQPF